MSRAKARLLTFSWLVIAGLVRMGYAQPAQTAPLTLKVMTVSESSLWANMTLVMGKTDAALIDVPFTRSDEHRKVQRPWSSLAITS